MWTQKNMYNLDSVRWSQKQATLIYGIRNQDVIIIGELRGQYLGGGLVGGLLKYWYCSIPWPG